MPPIFIYFLLAVFSFILANKSTAFLFTFGSAFIHKCKQKQSILIINYFLLALFSFILVNKSMMPPIFIYFLLALFSFVLVNESNPSTLIYYLLLALLVLITVNKYTPIPYFNNKRQYSKVRRKRNDERSEELSENRQLGCWGNQRPPEFRFI